jgi:hypothetical protein
MSNPALLEVADEVLIAGTIHAYSRIFGAQLGDQVNETLSAKASPSWFATLRQDRKAANLVAYDDYRDPRFLLKEALDDEGIVHYGIENFDQDWKVVAAALRRKLNAWFHGSLEPNLETFVILADGLRYLADRSKLPIANDLMANVNRARAIQAGDYVSRKPAPVPEVASDHKEFAERLKAKKEEIIKRPPIGSEWLGSKGTRKIVISKVLRDVTENGVSIKSQLGPDPDEVVTSWLRYYPKGGEAKVADDGAVMGYSMGQAYLIGWLDIEKNATSGAVRGFELPYEYIFTGSDVRDVVSGKLLSTDATEPVTALIESLKSALSAGDFLTITPYGEILKPNESAEPGIAGVAHKNIWFKGHLPG